MDVPNERKVHTHPIPRTGGTAIFIAFVLALILVVVADTDVSRLIVLDQQRIFLMIGGVICFFTGLADDFRRLPAWVKLMLQIVAASIAYAGGIDIANMSVHGFSIGFGIASYGITVFWFLLFINAVNLVDGLDGLAGGVTFFSAMMMVVLSTPPQEEMDKACMYNAGGSNRRTTPMTVASICLREKPPEFKWMREVLAYLNSERTCSRCLIRIELPLEIPGCDRQYGCLVLIKDSRMGNLSHAVLKRMSCFLKLGVRSEE